jgi:hypothetical protein
MKVLGVSVSRCCFIASFCLIALVSVGAGDSYCSKTKKGPPTKTAASPKEDKDADIKTRVSNLMNELQNVYAAPSDEERMRKSAELANKYFAIRHLAKRVYGEDSEENRKSLVDNLYKLILSDGFCNAIIACDIDANDMRVVKVPGKRGRWRVQLQLKDAQTQKTQRVTLEFVNGMIVEVVYEGVPYFRSQQDQQHAARQ